jgi:hypothetical protein
MPVSNASEKCLCAQPVSKAWGGGGAGNKKSPGGGAFLKINFEMCFV